MKFAIVKNGIVTNMIEAESKAIADEVTGEDCIPCSDKPFASIGGTYDGSNFVPVQNFPSWTFNPLVGWEPPVVKPVFDSEDPHYYTWDEETVSWKEVIPPQE
jgi:hypothetical protein